MKRNKSKNGVAALVSQSSKLAATLYPNDSPYNEKFTVKSWKGDLAKDIPEDLVETFECPFNFLDYARDSPMKMKIYASQGKIRSTSIIFFDLQRLSSELAPKNGSVSMYIDTRAPHISKDINSITGTDRFEPHWTMVSSWRNVVFSTGVQYTFQFVITADKKRKKTFFIILLGTVDDKEDSIFKIQADYDSYKSIKLSPNLDSSNVEVSGMWLFQYDKPNLIEKFPKGPSSVNIVMNRTNYFLNANDPNDVITATCDVYKDDVFPKPTFSLVTTLGRNKPDIYSIPTDKYTDTKHKYRASFQFNQKVSGKISVKCIARNSMVSSKSAESVKIINTVLLTEILTMIKVNQTSSTKNSSQHFVETGRMVPIACTAVGIFPPEMVYTLTCRGYKPVTKKGEIAYLFPTVQKQGNVCECITSLKGFSDKQISAVIVPCWGPTKVDIVAKTSYLKVKDENDVMKTVCEVSKHDVSHKPTVSFVATVINDNKPLDAVIYSGESTDNEKYIFYFKFKPKVSVVLSVKCVARGKFISKSVESSPKTISAIVIEELIPVIEVNGVGLKKYGDEYSLAVGRPVHVTCFSDGHNITDVVYTLTCPGYQTVTKKGNIASIDIKVQKQGHDCKCKISLQNFGAKEVSVSIIAFHGPTSVNIFMESSNYFLNRRDNNDVVETTCVVSRDDVFPKPTFSLETTLGISKPVIYGIPTHEYTDTKHNKYRTSFQFKPNVSGNISVKCIARNSNVSSKSAESVKIINVVLVKEILTLIKVNKVSSPNGSKHIMEVGRNVHLSCYANGIAISEMVYTMSCQGYKPVSKKGESAHFDLIVQKQRNVCECKTSLKGSVVKHLSVVIEPMWGPNKVDIVANTFYLNGKDENDVMKTVCEVSKDDVSPKPTVSLVATQKNDNKPLDVKIRKSESTDNEKYLFFFKFKPKVSVVLTVKCVARGKFISKSVESSPKTISAIVIENQIPVIKDNEISSKKTDDEYLLEVGRIVPVSCPSDGHVIPEMDYTLTCSGYQNVTEWGNIASIDIKVQKQGHDCKCKISLPNFGAKVVSFSILAFYGPTSVDIVMESSNYFLNPKDDNDVVTATCEVSKDDVFPKPTVDFEKTQKYDKPLAGVIQKGELTDKTMYRFTFSFKPKFPGEVNAICIVISNVSSKSAESTKTITVTFVEELIPMILLNNLKVKENSSSIFFKLGEKVKVACSADGAITTFMNLTLSCRGYNSVNKIGASVSYDVTAQKQGHVCDCITSLTGFGHKNISVNIEAAYGPSSVSSRLLNERVSLCPVTGVTDNVTVYCEVSMDDVYPKFNVIATVEVDMLDENNKIYYYYTPEDVIEASGLYQNIFSFMLPANDPGFVNVTCTANNSVEESEISVQQHVILEIMLDIEKPVITREGDVAEDMLDGSFELVHIGDVLKYICTLPTNSNDSLDMTCEDNVVTLNNVASAVTINVTRGAQNSSCVCKRSGCYDAETAFRFRLVYKRKRMTERSECRKFEAWTILVVALVFLLRF